MSRQNGPLVTSGGVIVIPPDPGGGSVGGDTPTGPAASGTTTNFPMSVIAYSAPEMQNPFRGLVNWNEACTNRSQGDAATAGPLDGAYAGNLCPVPESGTPQGLINLYGRDQDWCNWRQMEPSLGVYNFDGLEARAAKAHAIGGQYGFRIMTYGQGGAGYGNTQGNNVMPQYIQSNPGTYGGTGSGSGFVPNSNNNAYLLRLEALWAAIGARFGNDPRFGLMDIGMYGPAGEWWTGGSEPGGAITFASGKRIVDAHVNNMPQCQFVALPGDAQSGTTQTLEYCMTLQTSKGLWIGQRGDSLGCVNHWYETLQLPYYAASGGATQWQRAPVFGEVGNIQINDSTWQSRLGPANGNYAGSTAWEDVYTQTVASHLSMVGNGNCDQPFNNYSDVARAAWINAGKHAGYRIQLNSFTCPNKIEAGSHATFTANWQNVGVAPPYRSWKPVYLLKNTAGVTVWKGNSGRDFKFMLPSGTNSQTAENFNFPGTLPSGTLSLYVQVQDPSGYFTNPLNLANANRTSDGAYPIGTIVVP